MPATSANAPTSVTAAPAPVSSRAAMAVLGSMVFLIIALTILLVQTTWVNPVSTADAAPVIYHAELGSR